MFFRSVIGTTATFCVLWSSNVMALNIPNKKTATSPTRISEIASNSAIPCTSFKINLNIGQDDDSRVLLKDLRVKPGREPSSNIPMPGSGGPNPKLSSGSVNLDVVSSPTFIDLKGLQTVRFERGAWELIWRNDAPAGLLVFGFDCPEGATRNGAMLPKGRMYTGFTVWTLPNLLQLQEIVTRVQEISDDFAKQKDGLIQEMRGTANPLMKALKFREACVALEKSHTFSNIVGKVPEIHDTVDLDGLLVCVEGTVWCKGKQMFGPSHSLLGHCRLELLET